MRNTIMLTTVLKRAGSIAVTLLGLLALTFFMGRMLPVDPVVSIIGEQADQATYDMVFHQLGRDKPLITQFFLFVRDMLHLDFGNALFTGHRVADDLAKVFPATIELATFAIIIGVAFGVPLGMLAAIYRGSVIDQIARVIGLLGYSTPTFWSGLMGLMIFYAALGLVGGPGRLDVSFIDMVEPHTGLLLIDSLIDGEYEVFWNAWRHIVLPGSVLGFVAMALISRLTLLACVLITGIVFIVLNLLPFFKGDHAMSQTLSLRDWLVADIITSPRQARMQRLYLGWLRLRANPLALVGLGIIALLVLTAIFANVIAPYGFDDQSLEAHKKPGLDRRALLTTAAIGGTAGSIMAPGVAYAQAAAAPPLPDPAPASAAIAAKAVESTREAILRISREVWTNAERTLAEEKSAAIHVRELRAAGFTVTTGTSNIPTAFLAKWSQGEGGPKIGFLPEYDALPSLGNAAEPRNVPGPTGFEVGHGCGHNMLGAGCTGAAIALKKMMEQDKTPGTILVFGCAAEEGGAVKTYMARDHLFDDVDAALSWHPAPVAVTGAIATAANNGIRIKFHGQSAHAGVAPWEGRSALKAAELFGIGIQFMREHVQPTARLHYVYEDAGLVPNVVPDFAQILLTIRDKNRQNVVAMTEWAKSIADGAALMTQTTTEFQVFTGVYPILPNDTLIALTHRHMKATPISWTEAEQVFAKTVQKAMSLPEKGLARAVAPILGEITTGGGSDCGDVSFNTPLSVFGWPTMPLGVGLHTWGVTACGGMSIGDKAALATATIMAGIGHDMMTSAELRKAAKADLIRRRGDHVYVSPIPPEITQPPGIPAYLIKAPGDEILTDVSSDG
eukprot:gene10846-10926_t